MKSIKPWTMPSHYFGATWENWYSVGFGQSRDSDVLEASNFTYVWSQLKPLRNPNGIIDPNEDADLGEVTDIRIVRENHWAVGWVEWIAIHQSNTAALDKARELCERANDYPVLDEDDFSRREDEQCEQLWHDCFNAGERIDYLRRHSYTAQSFGDVLQAVRNGSWCHAANMLHSPNDILY